MHTELLDQYVLISAQFLLFDNVRMADQQTTKTQNDGRFKFKIFLTQSSTTMNMETNTETESSNSSKINEEVLVQANIFSNEILADIHCSRYFPMLHN